jgi:hypothetical protein
VGAADLHAQEHRAHGACHFVKHDVPAFFLQVDIRHIRAAQQKAGGNRGGGVLRFQFIPGDLH